MGFELMSHPVIQYAAALAILRYDRFSLYIYSLATIYIDEKQLKIVYIRPAYTKSDLEVKYDYVATQEELQIYKQPWRGIGTILL